MAILHYRFKVYTSFPRNFRVQYFLLPIVAIFSKVQPTAPAGAVLVAVWRRESWAGHRERSPAGFGPAAAGQDEPRPQEPGAKLSISDYKYNLQEICTL